MAILETRRLILRPLELDDLDDLHALYSQELLMRYITGHARTYQVTRQRLEAHLSDWSLFGFGFWAAILRATGQMIGRCGLEPVMTTAGLEGNMGWMFQPAHWGQGLATEVGWATLRYGFEQLELERIYATADRRNLSSIRVMEKIGLNLVHETERAVKYDLCRSVWLAGKDTT